MADFPLNGPVHGSGIAPIGRTLGTATTWAGAVVSFALLGGIGIWGYQLLVRDVTGVPVVRALEGPMRVSPEDPGGVAADHQGLSVNQVAGQGAAQPAPDRLLLAPEQQGIAETDATVGAVPLQTALTDTTVGREELAPETNPIAPLVAAPTEPQAVIETSEVANLAAEAQTPAPTAAAPTTAAPSGTNATIQALADQIAAGVAPLSDTGPADTPPVKTEVAGTVVTPEVTAKPTPKGALARSLRPQLRPANLRTVRAPAPAATTPVTAAVAAVASASGGEADAATIPAGTRLVQLGAFDSPEVARSEWTRLSGKFDEYLDGKTRVIQRAKSGGRVFYRLRAMGFADLNDARRFCSALTAQRADCIPLVTR